MSRKLFFLGIILLLSLNTCVANMGIVKYIFRYANQRLEIMRAIAAYKYKNKLYANVTIPERMELRHLFLYVHGTGLDLKSAHLFIMVNLSAGKHYQRLCIQQWHHYGFPKDEKVDDLGEVLLPMLIQIDRKMWDSIVLALPTLHDPKNLSEIKKLADQELTVKYLSPRIKALYVKSLLSIKEAH